MAFASGSRDWGLRSFVLATFYASGGKYYVVGADACSICVSQQYIMSGPHYIPVHKRRVTGRTAMEYLSPDDVEAFCTAILDTGVGRRTLLTAEYPRA